MADVKQIIEGRIGGVSYSGIAIHWEPGGCCLVSRAWPERQLLELEAAKRRGETIRVVITTHPPEVNRGIRGWLRKLRRSWQAFRKEMRHG